MLRMPIMSTRCINDQYRSLHGSLRFLHNIVRFPGCGVFEAEQSWVLRDQRDGCAGGDDCCVRALRPMWPTLRRYALRSLIAGRGWDGR